MDNEIEAFGNYLHRIEPRVPVGIVAIDRLPAITTGSDMIERTYKLES